MPLLDELPKRERAILEILYAKGEATARDVQSALDDGTSYSAIRAFLATLENRGCVSHRLEGQRYLWFPVEAAEREGGSALLKTMRTFFEGSRERAIAALLGADERPLDTDEYRRLRDLIDKARKGKE